MFRCFVDLRSEFGGKMWNWTEEHVSFCIVNWKSEQVPARKPEQVCRSTNRADQNGAREPANNISSLRILLHLKLGLRSGAGDCCCCCSLLHGGRLDEVVIASLLLEELCEVGLAVQNAIQSGVGWWSQEAAPMGAPEARLMIRCSLHSQLQTNNGLLLSRYVKTLTGRNRFCVKRTVKQRCMWTFSSGYAVLLQRAHLSCVPENKWESLLGALVCKWDTIMSIESMTIHYISIKIQTRNVDSGGGRI